MDPAQQYGEAYTNSIFVTEPDKALEMAQRQLREKAGEDLSRYCAHRGLNGDEIIAIIEDLCGALVPIASRPLELLTDEQVAVVWTHVDGAMR